MATRYQDLVDIDGLNKAIKQAEANSGRFRNAATDDFKRINTYASTLRAELERINRTLVNGGKPIQIITQGEAQRVVDLSNQVSNLTRELTIQKKAVEALSSVMAANKAAISDAKVQAANYTTELARLKAESQATANANNSFTSTVKANQAAQSAVALQTAQATLKLKELSLANKQAATTQVAATGSYKEAQQRLTALGNAIKNAEGGFKSTTPAIQAQIKEYNTLNDGLKKFDAQMGNHQRNVGNYSGALNNVIGDLKSLALGYLSVQGALAAGTAIFDAALKNSATRASLEFTLGSAQATDDKLHDLGNTANRLGVNFESLTESYAKFAGAAKASNFPLDQTDKIFNSIVGAGARFHLTADQISGSLLAVQQMISKGTVQSEELRGQLGERLPGAFSIAARSMGVTEMQLGKLLQSGQVLSKDLLPKLSIELDKTFNLDKTTQVESLQASVSKLGNTFTEAVSEQTNISTFFQGFIDSLTSAATAITKLVNSNSWSEFWYRFSKKSQDEAGEAMHAATIAMERIANIQNQSGNAINRSTAGGISTATQRAEIAKLVEALNLLRKNYDNVEGAANKVIDLRKRIADLKNISVRNLTDDSLDTQAQVDQRIALLQKESSAQIKYSEVWNRIQALKAITFKTSTKEISDAQLTSIKEIRTRIAELSKLPGSAIDGSVINNRIDALKARLKELSPSTKAVKEGFAELEEKLRAVNTQVEISVLRDYTNHQGKESASTRALAEQYSKLAQQLVKVKDAKDAALDGVSRRQKIATFGSVFPTLGGQAPSSIPIPDFSRDEALNASNDALGKLDEVALAYAKLNRDITDQYRKRQITKEQYDQQMVQSEEHQIIEEFTLNRTAIDKRLEYLQLSNKQNTKEYTQLLTQRATLDRTYNDKRIVLELKAAERVKAIYADVFSTIQQSASTIGGATGGLIGNIGTILEKSLVNQKNGTSFSDSEKLQAGLSVAGSAVGIYTETAINASKMRMAQIEAEYQNELKLAGDNEEAKTKITNEYNRKAKEEQLKQARYQKAAAATEIIINTAIAVSKAIAQGGGLFGIPLAAIVGALGAVQLGLVLAQPLPQYAVGRNGGKEEYAMVNENGPELIGQGGVFRIANQGRKGITRLRSGDSVKTAATTQHMFASGAVARSTEMANNMGGAKAAYDTYVMTVAQSPGLSEDQTANAVSRGMNGLPLNNFSFDERGHNRYQSRVKDRQSFNRSRNQL